MKASISLEKYRIKLKGGDKKFSVLIYLNKCKTYAKPDNTYEKLRLLVHQVMENNKDLVDPNENEELLSLRFALDCYRENIGH